MHPLPTSPCTPCLGMCAAARVVLSTVRFRRTKKKMRGRKLANGPCVVVAGPAMTSFVDLDFLLVGKQPATMTVRCRAVQAGRQTVRTGRQDCSAYN